MNFGSMFIQTLLEITHLPFYFDEIDEDSIRFCSSVSYSTGKIIIPCLYNYNRAKLLFQVSMLWVNVSQCFVWVGRVANSSGKNEKKPLSTTIYWCLAKKLSAISISFLFVSLFLSNLFFFIWKPFNRFLSCYFSSYGKQPTLTLSSIILNCVSRVSQCGAAKFKLHNSDFK